jgi:glutamate synthase (NADPH/NADH) large chain
VEFGSVSLRQTKLQDHGLLDAIDNQLIEVCQPAISNAEPVSAEFSIRNVNRTVGTMLGSRVTRAWGGKGLPENTIQIKFRGSAGQSFGAFIPTGVTLRLEGDANDYVGKGLSGGKIAIHPSANATFIAEENIIAGNVIGYGATSGKIFLRGRTGERFAVRNSGATLVTEGVGDHGCEYMTGGIVVILGATGRNFAAGMSGGVAYVLDLQKPKVNLDMVALQKLDAKDRELLHELLTEHIQETDSQIAKDLINNWIVESERITKVMPTDYQRVLQLQSRAISDGLDPNLEVMKLFAVGGPKSG